MTAKVLTSLACVRAACDSAFSVMRTAVATLLLAFPVFAARPFTIEQVLSSPFPSNLTASPKGNAVAWVMNSRGVRNVWVARAPSFMASAVTTFTQDDGQELDDLAWKADGSALFFTRGGGANGRGEFPNPRSSPEEVRQEVWMAALASSASTVPASMATAHKIGDGHSLAAAPDGSGVAWVQTGQIWWAASKDDKPVQMLHARGNAEDLQWSPDAHHLAFTSVRGDHAFIAVYDVPSRTVSFPDPSIDRDQSPAWSPDGRQLAFIRLPAFRDAPVFGPKRTGEPWSIRLVDASSGKTREIWRAQPGMGSVFWPLATERQLMWAMGERLVFPWERDGWQHLFSIRTSAGSEVTPLTPGEFEVEHAATTADGKSVIFASNQGDPDRRHVWRVDAGGGIPQQLTSGAGIEWRPAPLAGGQVVVLRSDAKMPARAALVQNGAVRDLVPAALPAEFPTAELIEPQPVVYTSPDGMKIHAQLFLPSSSGSAAKHPAVVFFHGGSRREMLLGWNPMSYYHQAYGFNQFLASRGFAVLSVNYRSGTGYGEEFREALRYGATGASEFDDVKGAALYLRSRPDIDPAHIGAWGGSYGGYLTALALSRASDLFAAGVDLHGVHNWNLEFDNTIPEDEPGHRADVIRLAFESSPVASIATWRSPVLLIQGDDDRTVPFAETIRLGEALRHQGVHFEQLIFPDEVHDFLLYANWITAYKRAAEFLERLLKP